MKKYEKLFILCDIIEVVHYVTVRLRSMQKNERLR